MGDWNGWVLMGVGATLFAVSMFMQDTPPAGLFRILFSWSGTLLILLGAVALVIQAVA